MADQTIYDNLTMLGGDTKIRLTGDRAKGCEFRRDEPHTVIGSGLRVWDTLQYRFVW